MQLLAIQLVYIYVYTYIYIPDCFARCFFIIPSSSSISLSPFRFVRFFLAYVSISYASRRYTFSQVDVSLKFPTLFFSSFLILSSPYSFLFSCLRPLLPFAIVLYYLSRNKREEIYIYSYTSKGDATLRLSSDINEISLGKDIHTYIHIYIYIYRINFDPFLSLASIFFLRQCSREMLVPKASNEYVFRIIISIVAGSAFYIPRLYTIEIYERKGKEGLNSR